MSMRSMTIFALLVPMMAIASVASAEPPGPPSGSGDYDGDGLDDMVIWRPSDGTWYIRRSGPMGDYNNTFSRQWGLGGDVPIPDSDFDGDSLAAT